jgi:hypothetical protein
MLLGLWYRRVLFEATFKRALREAALTALAAMSS